MLSQEIGRSCNKRLAWFTDKMRTRRKKKANRTNECMSEQSTKENVLEVRKVQREIYHSIFRINKVLILGLLDACSKKETAVYIMEKQDTAIIFFLVI